MQITRIFHTFSPQLLIIKRFVGTRGCFCVYFIIFSLQSSSHTHTQIKTKFIEQWLFKCNCCLCELLCSYCKNWAVITQQNNNYNFCMGCCLVLILQTSCLYFIHVSTFYHHPSIYIIHSTSNKTIKSLLLLSVGQSNCSLRTGQQFHDFCFSFDFLLIFFSGIGNAFG